MHAKLELLNEKGNGKRERERGQTERYREEHSKVSDGRVVNREGNRKIEKIETENERFWKKKGDRKRVRRDGEKEGG